MDENTTLINITIDEDLRTLTIPTNGTVFGVVGDISVNRVMFVLPRYFRGFDLTECTARVNYCNPNGDANYYEADDLAALDGNTTFTWLMGPDVTSYIGDVKFSIQLYKKDEGGKIVKNFNTKYATGKVLEGYNVEQSITPEQQETLVEKISKEVKESIKESVNNEIKETILTELSSDIDKKKNEVIADINNETNFNIVKNSLIKTHSVQIISSSISENQKKIVSGIKSVQYEDNDICKKYDIRVCAVLNTDDYPFLIILKNGESGDENFHQSKLIYDPDTKKSSGLFDSIKITIEYDWDNLTVGHNVLYKDCKIRLVSGFNNDIEKINNDIEKINNDIEEINNDPQVSNIIELLDIQKEITEDISGITNVGYIINTSNKVTAFNNKLFKVTTYPVSANTIYLINGNLLLPNGGYPAVIFTSDIQGQNDSKVIIGPSDNLTTKTYIKQAYTVRKNGYIQVMSASIDPLKVSNCKDVSGIIKTLTQDDQENEIKIQVFGDSISDELWRSDKTTWVNLLQKYIPQRKLIITNHAVGGSSIGHGYANNGSGSRYPEKTEGNCVCDLIDDGTYTTDSDIVILLIGTNNWAGGSALGVWGDSETTTFYGAARHICNTVTKNKNLLFICTPPGRYNSTDETREINSDGIPLNAQSKTLREYCDALIKTANFYGCPTIDLNYVLGWSINNVKLFCADGLHPTIEGADIIARYIATQIKQHLGI